MSAPSFDTIAPVYDHLAQLVFGNSLKQAQTFFLDAIPAKANILIIGGGTGWILQKLLQNRHLNRIDYVEASIQMLYLSRRKYNEMMRQQTLPSPTEVNFIHGTENDLPQDITYDAIITFFVLDTQSDSTLFDMMNILYLRLAKLGIWLFADFKISKNKWEQWWHRLLVHIMFVFFRLTCHLQNKHLPDYDRNFTKLELIKIREKSFYGNLIISEVYRKI